METLDRESVTRRVQEILEDVLNLDRPPSPDARLIEDLGAESVDVLALLFEFEEAFGRSIPDERVAALVTVGDVVEEILHGAAA